MHISPRLLLAVLACTSILGGCATNPPAAAHAPAQTQSQPKAETPACNFSKLERRTTAVAAPCVAATVALVLEDRTKQHDIGSGVVVSADGLVASAAHVLMKPGSTFLVRFADGRMAHAVALGMDHKSDAGLARITDQAPDGGWSFRPLAPASSLKEGDWVLAAGHPLGIFVDRPPVLRLGKVLDHEHLASDCALAPGDSGGPLFDLEGRVVGVHHGPMRHAPVSIFHEKWSDFLASKAFEQPLDDEEPQEQGAKGEPKQAENEVCEECDRDLRDSFHEGQTLKMTGISAQAHSFIATIMQEATGKKLSDAQTVRFLECARYHEETGVFRMGNADCKELFGMEQTGFADKMQAYCDRMAAGMSDVNEEKGLFASLLLNPELSRLSAGTPRKKAPAMPAELAKRFALGKASVVRVLGDGLPVKLGTVVAADGWIVAPAEGLDGKLTVTLPDGRTVPGKLVSKDRESGLALLKVEEKGLTPAVLSAAKSPGPGALVILPAVASDTIELGVVSTAARPIPAPASPFTGFPAGSAEHNGTVEKLDAAIRRFNRDAHIVLSARRSGFPEAFTHDVPVHPRNCGGTVLSRDGAVLGINVCRSESLTTMALPNNQVLFAIERLLPKSRKP